MHILTVFLCLYAHNALGELSAAPQELESLKQNAIPYQKPPRDSIGRGRISEKKNQEMSPSHRAKRTAEDDKYMRSVRFTINFPENQNSLEYVFRKEGGKRKREVKTDNKGRWILDSEKKRTPHRRGQNYDEEGNGPPEDLMLADGEKVKLKSKWLGKRTVETQVAQDEEFDRIMKIKNKLKCRKKVTTTPKPSINDGKTPRIKLPPTHRCVSRAPCPCKVTKMCIPARSTCATCTYPTETESNRCESECTESCPALMSGGEDYVMPDGEANLEGQSGPSKKPEVPASRKHRHEQRVKRKRAHGERLSRHKKSVGAGGKNKIEKLSDCSCGCQSKTCCCVCGTATGPEHLNRNTCGSSRCCAGKKVPPKQQGKT